MKILSILFRAVIHNGGRGARQQLILVEALVGQVGAVAHVRLEEPSVVGRHHPCQLHDPPLLERLLGLATPVWAPRCEVADRVMGSHPGHGVATPPRHAPQVARPLRKRVSSADSKEGMVAALRAVAEVPRGGVLQAAMRKHRWCERHACGECMEGCECDHVYHGSRGVVPVLHANAPRHRGCTILVSTT